MNTARGSIIGEEALTEELARGKFKAVLDVYEKEPLPYDSRLRTIKNVILIPHMAGSAIDRRKLVTFGLVDDIKAYFNGGALKNEITKEYAAHMTDMA